MKKGNEKKKRKKKKEKRISGMDYYGFVWIFGLLYGYYFVPFLGFSEEFILTLDLLKDGLVKP